MSGPRAEAKMDFYGSLCLFPVLVGFGYYSLSRVLRVDKLDPLWRRLIILCAATMLFYNVCCGVFGYTALFMLEKDSKSGSLGMILCRASLFGLHLSDGWLYCAFLLFYFHRLNIAFARASPTLRISKCTSRTMYFSILLMALFPLPMGVWVTLDSTEPWSPDWGYYCQSPKNKIRFGNFWFLWGASWIILSILITYLYIVKLRQIMIVVQPGEQASVSVEHQNAKIVYIVKKAAVITIVSCFTTSVLFILADSDFLWSMDGFLNCVFIFCNFESGNPLFNLMFYPCVSKDCCCQRKCIDLSSYQSWESKIAARISGTPATMPAGPQVLVGSHIAQSVNPNAEFSPL